MHKNSFPAPVTFSLFHCFVHPSGISLIFIFSLSPQIESFALLRYSLP
nr:MAG TPA: hypothetical protein [Caudoviricetes sp.]